MKEPFHVENDCSGDKLCAARSDASQNEKSRTIADDLTFQKDAANQARWLNQFEKSLLGSSESGKDSKAPNSADSIPTAPKSGSQLKSRGFHNVEGLTRDFCNEDTVLFPREYPPPIPETKSIHPLPVLHTKAKVSNHWHDLMLQLCETLTEVEKLMKVHQRVDSIVSEFSKLETDFETIDEAVDSQFKLSKKVMEAISASQKVSERVGDMLVVLSRWLNEKALDRDYEFALLSREEGVLEDGPQVNTLIDRAEATQERLKATIESFPEGSSPSSFLKREKSSIFGIGERGAFVDMRGFTSVGSLLDDQSMQGKLEEITRTGATSESRESALERRVEELEEEADLFASIR